MTTAAGTDQRLRHLVAEGAALVGEASSLDPQAHDERVQVARVALRWAARTFGEGLTVAKAQAAGYHVKLIFLRLRNPEEAVARVAQRVRQGGHDVPEAVIRRRFAAGERNFERLYAPRADAWALYDSSGTRPVLLDWREGP